MHEIENQTNEKVSVVNRGETFQNKKSKQLRIPFTLTVNQNNTQFLRQKNTHAVYTYDHPPQDKKMTLTELI